MTVAQALREWRVRRKARRAAETPTSWLDEESISDPEEPGGGRRRWREDDRDEWDDDGDGRWPPWERF